MLVSIARLTWRSIRSGFESKTTILSKAKIRAYLSIRHEVDQGHHFALGGNNREDAAVAYFDIFIGADASAIGNAGRLIALVLFAQLILELRRVGNPLHGDGSRIKSIEEP